MRRSVIAELPIPSPRPTSLIVVDRVRVGQCLTALFAGSCDGRGCRCRRHNRNLMHNRRLNRTPLDRASQLATQSTTRREGYGVDTSSRTKPTCPGPTIITGQVAVLTHSRATADRLVDLPFAVRPRPIISSSAPALALAKPSIVGTSRTWWRTRTSGNSRAYKATAWLGT